MKKNFIVFCLFTFVIFGLSAQDSFPDLKRYFMLANQLDNPNWDFKKAPILGDDPKDSAMFSNLTDVLTYIDSYLEFALLTYYSAAEKPWAERGNSVLPLNNPRLVDRQLGAYVYKDIVIYRFLNDTAAVTRHEAILKFITDRKNVTRPEVETFFRNNIRDLVSQIVDEQLASRCTHNPNFQVSANSLSAIKNVITEFILSPSEATYKNLLAAYRGGTGNAPLLIGLSMEQINTEINRALIDNRIPGSR